MISTQNAALHEFNGPKIAALSAVIFFVSL